MFKDRRFRMVFDPSFSLLKFSTNYLGNEAQMICAGSIYTDYVKFINLIKEAA